MNGAHESLRLSQKREKGSDQRQITKRRWGSRGVSSPKLASCQFFIAQIGAN